MKKLFTKLAALAVAGIMTVGMFTGCSSQQTTEQPAGEQPAQEQPAAQAPSSGGSVDIGIVLPTKDEPRWVQDETRFIDALKDTDYSVEILFSQGSSAKEKENVEALLAKGIKVLIICPHDGAAAAAAAEAAKAEGVTVISYDRLITDTDAVDYCVTFDSVAVGKAQGQCQSTKQAEQAATLLICWCSFDSNAFLFFEGAWSITTKSC